MNQVCSFLKNLQSEINDILNPDFSFEDLDFDKFLKRSHTIGGAKKPEDDTGLNKDMQNKISHTNMIFSKFA